MQKRVMVLSILFGLLLMPVFGAPSEKAQRFTTMAFRVVHMHWVVANALYAAAYDPSPAHDANYQKVAEIFAKNSAELSRGLLTCLSEKDREPIEVISQIYKELDPAARMAFYDALQPLRFQTEAEFGSGLSAAEFREYFPGYGYTEPGYKYRKGREIDREAKGFSWQNEEQTITSTFNAKLTINIDLLGIFQGLLTSGVIKNLNVGKEFTMNVNGQPMICAEISFQLVKSITTKTNRKFEVSKVWFELLRTKSSGGWGAPPAQWELCGKTYEILQEPTGEAVVTDAKAVN